MSRHVHTLKWALGAQADMPMVAQIKQLSAHIAERLRSDLVVTSLTQGVEELVSNSIDAGATDIKVGSTLNCLRKTVGPEHDAISPNPQTPAD